MKVCAFSSCRKDSTRNPKSTFFNLPKDPCARSEWLEVLGLKYKDSIQNIYVCDAHFRPKEFCIGRRQLKRHAVPVLNPGIGKIEPVSDDDMQCDSDMDNDDAILAEVKKFSSAEVTMDIKTEKKEAVEEQEPETPGRRPSRRAAVEAAKKISNTVRNYGTAPDTEDPDVSDHFTHRTTTSSRSSPRGRRAPRQQHLQHVKFPQPNIELLLECHEELLSTVQAEALLQAQLQYNMVMKTLRNLKASNVRIIVAPADPVVSDDAKSNSSDTEESPTQKAKDEIPPKTKADAAKSENGSVFPMELSANVASPAPILS